MDSHRPPSPDHQHHRKEPTEDTSSFLCDVSQQQMSTTPSVFLSVRQACTGCKSPPFVPPATPFDVEIHEMELCGVLKAQDDEDADKASKDVAEDEAEEEEDGVEQETKTQEEAAAAAEEQTDSHSTGAAGHLSEKAP